MGGEPGRSAELAFLLLALHPALGPPFRILGPLFLKNNFYWSVADLQRCVSFRCTAKRRSYTDICVCSVARSCPTLLQPHELQLARPPCPRDFPGHNTGAGCSFLLHQVPFYSKGERRVFFELPPGSTSETEAHFCLQLQLWSNHLNFHSLHYLPGEANTVRAAEDEIFDGKMVTPVSPISPLSSARCFHLKYVTRVLLTTL